MTDERLHLTLAWTFGFSLLFMIGGLGATVAIGKVEMQTSYGLPTLLGCLATLTGGFAQWAFRTLKEKGKTE